MTSFGLTNFRRFEKTGAIELRPITILVGRNSSGKSSFLRALPLLRQSLMTRTRSPVLWWGELVDFGTFQGTVHRNETDRIMSFEFGLESLLFSQNEHYPPSDMYNPDRKIGGIGLTLDLASSDGGERLSRISLDLKVPKSSLSLIVDDQDRVTSLKIDQQEMIKHIQPFEIVLEHGSIMPVLLVRAVSPDAGGRRFGLPPNQLTRQAIADLLGRYLHGNTSKQKASQLASAILSAWPLDIKKLELLRARAPTGAWNRILESVQNEGGGKLLKDLNALSFVGNAIPVLSALFSNISDMISQILYIGPARARSERYYRYQDLAVSEIDADGKNFPMFLNSLSRGHFDDLSKWISRFFDYGIKLSRGDGGHISISVVERSSTTNVIDTGYGISQLLPVLGQIWWATRRPKSRSMRASRGRIFNAPTIVAIEQPELHLHPAHQSMLADALVGAAIRDANQTPKPHNQLLCLVETHSESLVNRLGELVASKEVAAEDVQILIFEADQGENRSTAIRRAEFDQSGALQNWPYGFFQV